MAGRLGCKLHPFIPPPRTNDTWFFSGEGAKTRRGPKSSALDTHAPALPRPCQRRHFQTHPLRPCHHPEDFKPFKELQKSWKEGSRAGDCTGAGQSVLTTASIPPPKGEPL
ncbi:UNVERIFIED_CONTAM: hypothetical protein K2H54_001523 [Gekko kuhli]